MSWLFGVKAPLPGGGGGTDMDHPSTSGGGGGGSDNPDDPSRPRPKSGHHSSYEFDSKALERAAQAAKDLEKSTFASQALDLSKQQETTRQLELQAQIKQYEAGMEQNKQQANRMQEEERRKTQQQQAELARHRSDYEDQLARKRTADELEARRRNEEEMLKRQEESVRRQEEMRRATVEHELKKKHELDMSKLEAELRAKAKIDRENQDLTLEQIRLAAGERRTTIMEAIRTASSAFGAGAQAFLSDWPRVTTAAAGISLLALGVYSARNATSVAGRFIEARVGRPSLVRDTSRLTLVDALRRPIKTTRQFLNMKRGDGSSLLRDVVLAPTTESRLLDIAIMTKNTRTNRGMYRNVLFHGPPGTGKTMFAKRLALQSGLDYAILTGGDVAPMGRLGVSAMHKVFDWAETSRRGLLLFVDEADAFLRKRSSESISEDLRATLNAFLFRTGDQSPRVMLVLASNLPEQFDFAINDRLDEMVHFDLPGLAERERLFVQYFEQYIAAKATEKSRSRLQLADFDWVAKCKEVAARTKGLSGREIAKLVVSWQASAYASEDGILNDDIIDRRTAEVMRQHGQKMTWLQKQEKRHIDEGTVV